ncbi:hypothetical protein SETIT_2G124800v2 [Setaria italica]|uniref:Myb/SANT-like domain-containing protein n=1 Tax=Setaria italica TaxID=4555 RepID=A0A368PXW0_SETIT|nr:hypothetical protein SETIT_2G124800v2 [Setaria italica]
MSAFVLRRFTKLVRKGLKTDKGFKEVYNHLRKWWAKWVKISKLKELSGSNWDEENYMITLAPEHYKGHIKDHPKDAEYLNVSIKNFVQMQMIFGNGFATGRYAMGSNEALGQPFVEPKTMDVEADAPAIATATEATNDVESSRAKVGLGKRKRMGFAAAVHDAAHAEGYPGTYEACVNTPGFPKPLLMKALNHMTTNKASAIQFVKMSPEDRDLWMTSFLQDNNLL